MKVIQEGSKLKKLISKKIIYEPDEKTTRILSFGYLRDKTTEAKWKMLEDLLSQ